MASQNTWASMWVWPSMKPGVTTWPSASISRAPLADPADEGDAVADDPDVGPVGAQARAVDHRAVADHEVVGHVRPHSLPGRVMRVY